MRGAKLSPTSGQIAVTDREPGRNDIFLRDIDGSEAERFTLALAEDYGAVDNPDLGNALEAGRQIMTRRMN